MKQRELEMTLQSLKELDSPEAGLEQYITPAPIAADLLYIAFGMGDIGGKSVIDLGCGNGVFAIGACLLGAKDVYGIDTDSAAISVATENATAIECEIRLEQIDVSEVKGNFDTCIQNPPFGSQKKHADLPFLHKAVEIASVVYTIHNSRTVEFLEREISSINGVITHRKAYSLEIKHRFDFHTKEREFIDVLVFRIERGK